MVYLTIHLAHGPSVYDAKHKHEAHSKPSDDWGISVKVVDPKFLLSTMEIETGLVFGDLVRGEIALASQGPDGWHDCGSLRNL